jgi:hypothetical protein
MTEDVDKVRAKLLAVVMARRAECAAAKAQRAEYAIQGKEAKFCIMADRAIKAKWEERVTKTAALRGEMIALARAGGAAVVDKRLARYRIDVEVAQAKLAKSNATDAAAVEKLREADDALREAAIAVCEAERAVKCHDFTVTMDLAERLGRDLEFFIGPGDRWHLPAEIQAALARLPQRDPLHTPINELKFGRWASQQAWDERIRDLMLDAPAAEAQAESEKV